MPRKYRPQAKVTVRFLMDNYLWEDYCIETNTNAWVVAEGQLDQDEYVVVPESWEVKVKIPHAA